MKKTYIGGQALIEGVMMRGRVSSAMAVRDETGVIRLETTRLKSGKSIWKKIPVIRGVISFFESLIFGTKTLLKSGEVFIEDTNAKASEKKNNSNASLIAISLIISLALAIGLFFILPNIITAGFEKMLGSISPIWLNAIDGGVRLVIFLVYVILVTQVRDVKRVFMYHGAEHRTISCYEKELELTVENVQKCSTVHDRCGTSFLFFVMIVSIIVFSFAGWHSNIFIRIAIRLALLPLVAGLSYELLKLLSKTDFWLVKPLKWPGQLLQKLTTKKPDDDMAEVAIVAFKAVLEMENNPEILEVKFPQPKPLQDVKSEMLALIGDNPDLAADIDWILCCVTNLKRSELKKDIILSAGMYIRANKMLQERLTGKPLQYILGNVEFFGRKINVDKGVLIPRFETELLVDKCLPLISKKSKILDLCCGSGAIGITVKLEKECEVVASDISEKALNVAKKNAKRLEANIKFIKSDLFQAINTKFDGIICNPPYIKSSEISELQKEVKDFEPIIALDGGEDGLDFYKKIIPNLKGHLVENGFAAFEVGAEQAESVVKIAKESFDSIEVIKDFNSIDRIVVINNKEICLKN